jgi:hypothetical protein
MEEKTNKRYSLEFEVINGKIASIKMDSAELIGIHKITLDSYKIGDRKKETVTITFTDIESFKITNS